MLDGRSTEALQATTKELYKEQETKHPSEAEQAKFVDPVQGWPSVRETYAGDLAMYDAFVAVTGESGAITKPDATNTGLSDPGDLPGSPTTGTWTITDPNLIYDDVWHVGPVVVDARNVSLRNCLLDGDGGVAVTVNAGIDTVDLEDCEIFNTGTAAIVGEFAGVERCHIHTCNQDAVYATNTFYGNGRYEYCYITNIGLTTPGNAFNIASDGTGTGNIIQILSCNIDVPDDPGVNDVNASINQSVDRDSLVNITDCWINGGGNKVIIHYPTSDVMHVEWNRFGRDFQAGKLTSATDISDFEEWTSNVYDDDNSEADWSD